MREIRPSGAEGGGTSLRSPYPYQPRRSRSNALDSQSFALRNPGAPRHSKTAELRSAPATASMLPSQGDTVRYNGVSAPRPQTHVGPLPRLDIQLGDPAEHA